MQVLVVEDNNDLRELVIEALALDGLDALGVPHAGEALTLLRSGARPSLILLDRCTPVLDGCAFLREAATELDGISIVWVSGLDERFDHPAVVATLRKPFDLDDLVKLVRRHARA